MKSMKSTAERTNEKEVLKILSEQAPVGVCIVQDGKFCYINPYFSTATGYTADELVGKDSLEIVVPEGREKVRENTLKMLKGELLSPYQFRVICKDGSIIWVMATVRSIQYHGGRAVLGNYMEITERKQIEDAVRQSEENYRVLSEQAPVGVCIVQDEKFCYFNSNFPIAIGYTADELIGKDPLELIVPEDREMVRENEIKMLKGELLSPYQFRVIHKDGSIRWVMEVVRSVQYHGRRAVLGNYMEVTERKQIEEKLEESEQKYRLLFETSLDCIAQVDREGRYLAANPATARSLGVSLEELIGKTVFEVVPQEVAQHRLRMMKKALDEWQPQIFEDERAGRYFHHIVIPTKTSEQKEAVQVITRDITERRKMEEGLRQSEEKHRALFDSSVIGMFVMDAETMKVIMANQAAAKIIGFSSVVEAIGLNVFDFVFPDDREKAFKLTMEDMFEQDLRQINEIRVVTKDGRTIWISATGARIMHEGRLAGLISFTDVTERKEMEEALDLQRAYFQQLFDNSPDAIVVLDTDRRVVQANKGFEKLFGYSSGEIKGRTIKELIIPEDRLEEASAVLQTVFRGKVVRKETVRRRKDGSLLDVSMVAYSIRFDDKLVGIYSVYSDITERKQAVEALRQSEERYRTILEGMEDAYFEVDLGGHLTFVNNSVCRDLGYSREELIGMSYKGFTVEDNIESVFQVFNEVYRTGVPDKGFPWKTVRKDGVQGFAETSVSPLRNNKGEIIGFRGVGRDVTEREQVEEALQAERNKLQSIIDAMEDDLTIQDRDYNIIFQNEPARISTGGDHVGEKCYRVYEGQESICEDCPVEKVFKDDKPHTSERQRLLPSGELSFWENTANPIRDARGRVVSCIEIGRNITERKKQEQALADELTRRRLLVDQSLDGIVVLDVDAKVVEANQRFAEILGYTPEEVRELHTWDWDKNFPPEKILEMGRNVDEKGLHLETKHTRKDGSVIDVDISINAAMFGEQKLIFCVCRDITERKQAEEALRQSEEKHRALFDSSGIGMFVMDAETMKIGMCNQAAAKMLGFSSAEEAIGVNPLDFVLPEHREEAREISIKEMFEQDLRRTHEYRVVNKDGREGWVSVTGAKIMHEGRLAGLVSITDITERKQAVEALRQSEERYRTILEEMEDSYFEVDLGGHLTFVNNSVCRDLGYSREELIGMSYKDFTVKDNIESVFQVFNEVYRTGVPDKGFPWKTVRKDGVQGFAETSVSTLRNDKGEIIGFRGVGRDVTERKQAEEKLRQSRENYRALFDSSVIGALVVDAETMKVVMGNQAAVKMFGFSSLEEGAGVNPLDFVPPEDREKNLELIVKEVFEKDSREAVDLPAVTKDGRKIWVSATGARIMHKGRLASLFSFTDITERKQAEEKLRQSEENYKTLFNSSVIGMYVLDVETMKVVMGNRAAAKMAGFSSVGNGIGINPLDFVIPEDREEVLEIAAKEFEQDLRRTHEVRVVGKDGGTGWISITSAKIMHKGRLAALVSFNDITERKRMEEALRQSEENYRVLFNSAVIGMVVLDAETMKVVMANQAALNMFGLSSVDEAIALNPIDLIVSEDRERALESTVKDTFEQDLQRAYEFQAMTKDGREIWISTMGARVMHKGKLAGLISFTDITEQKRQRERLMMTDRLASLGELAAGAAHELNNPLTSIIGFSQLLMEKETPDDIREDLKLINNEAQRAVKVTRDLLTFARKHAPVKQHNQINSIIEDVLELRAYLQKMNGIKVERHLAPALPEIMVDYFQMQQVLLNIIINAEYFMTEAHNKGTLTITTKKQNSSVVISIADDGPGILPENLRRIFDPFFTTKETGSGTGLGLSICHGIVTEHGGQIYVRSQLGKGATVFVELPIDSRDHIKSML